MANQSDDSGKYWPYMILGFIFIGLFLGVWTVRSAISMPVSESNAYQKKYQDADTHINAILEAQGRFDTRYTLNLSGFVRSKFKPKDYARKHGKVMALTPNASIRYRLTDKNGRAVHDANVTLLLTRPQTRQDDQTFALLQGDDGLYASPKIVFAAPGRYLLRVRAQIGDAIGFRDTEAYLAP